MPEKNEEKPPEVIEIPKSEFDAMKQSISELETSKQELEVKSAKLEGQLTVAPIEQPPTAPAEKPKEMTKEEFNETMVSDPLAALDHYAQVKLAPVVVEQTKNQANANRKIAEQTHKDTFDKYGDEITQLEKTVDPALLAQPSAYDILVKQVRANHMDDIVAEEVKRQLEKAEGGETQETDLSLSNDETNRHVLPNLKTPEETPLNDDQQRIVKGLGITEEEYREFEDPNKSLIPEEA